MWPLLLAGGFPLLVAVIVGMAFRRECRRPVGGGRYKPNTVAMRRVSSRPE